MTTPPGPPGRGFLEAIIAAMSEEGELPDDPQAIEDMIERFNSLPFEERGRILGLGAASPDPREATGLPAANDRSGSADPWKATDPWQRLTAGMTMPPAPVPPPDLAEAAAAAPILVIFDQLRRFIGDGRKLTAKGNLGRADARALAAELGDPALELMAEIEADIRSADELGYTQLMLRWARAAGAIRVERQRMAATASWARLGPLRQVERATLGLLKKGLLQLAHGDWRWAPHALYQVLDEGVPHLMAVLWALPEPVEFDMLLEGAFAVCEELLAWGPASTEDLRLTLCRHGMNDIFEHLERAGMTRREGATTEEVPHGRGEPRGGTVELTDLGRAVLAGYVSEHGYPVPEVGEMAGRPLSDLLGHLGDWHADRVRAEFDVWVEAHSPADAAAGLAEALSGGYPNAEWPLAALSLAERLPAPHPESAARAMLATPARGHAMSWLASHGAADVPVDTEAMLTAGIEMFAMTASAYGDEQFQEMIGQIDDPLGFVADCASVGTPAAVEVLRAMGRTHADPAVAAAARKAAMRVASPAPSRSQAQRNHRAARRHRRR